MASRASLLCCCPSSPCISLGLVPHCCCCCWSGARARLLTDTKEESLHHLPCGSLDSRPSDDSTLHLSLSLSSFPTLSRQIDVVHNLNPPTYLSENTPRNNLTELGSSKFVFKYLEAKKWWIDDGSTFLVVLMSRKTSPDFTLLFSVFYCTERILQPPPLRG